MNITPAPAVLPVDFYVYEHLCASTGEVFYVGKGCDRRAWDVVGRSELWRRVANKHGVIVVVVMDGLQEWFSFELESSLICLHGRLKLGHGRLVNHTDGGEGSTGLKHRSESRQAMSAYAARLDVKMKRRIKALELNRDSEFIARRDAAAKAFWSNPSAREAASRRRGSGPILCVETGMVFSSAGDAEKWLRGNDHPKASKRSVSKCCNLEPKFKTAYGYTWQYA